MSGAESLAEGLVALARASKELSRALDLLAAQMAQLESRVRRLEEAKHEH